MESFLEPFDSIDELLIFHRILSSSENEDIDKAIDILNEYTMKKHEKSKIEVFLRKVIYCPKYYPLSFFENLNKLDVFIHNNKLRNFSAKHKVCANCAEKLETFNTFNAVVYMFNKGPLNCTYTVKKCRRCKKKFYLNFYIDQDGNRTFYTDVLNSDFYSFSNEIIFDEKLLRNLTSDILFKHSSFKSYTNSYNYFHLVDPSNLSKIKGKNLQEKRITECWFYYNFIKTRIDFEQAKEIRAFYVNELDDNLKILNIRICPLFSKYWGGNLHLDNCKSENCCQVVSIDGNYKINRLRCMYSTVKMRSEEFGNIEIGCPNTPLRKSYFCENHKSQDPKMSFNYGNRFFECNVSQIIPKRGKLSKENLTLYDSFINKLDQILYLVDYLDQTPFWATEKQIPESCLSKFLTKSETIENSTCNTLKSFSLPCEKKTRTVGEFLGVYNCGIICGFREIFGSESLVQATNFLLDVFDNIEQKSQFISYDDGCHLKKFIDSSIKIEKVTKRLEKMRNKTFIIDRFHYKGHKKENIYCKEICNPDNYKDIKDANTSVVEQINFWFSGYKYIVKHMNRERFKFFIFLICNEFNKANLKFNIVEKLNKK